MALLAGASLAAGEPPAFVSPRPGDIVVGPTVFLFSVPESEPPVERIDLYVGGRQIDSALPPEWRIEWDVPPELVGADYLAVVYSGGEVLDKLSLSTTALDLDEEIDVVEVQLFPVVVDRKGRYVSDLSADDFAIYDEGRPISIKSFQRQASSLALAMVLDVSASMQQDLPLMQEASCRFIDQLQPGDRVAVYAFNHVLMPEVALSESFEEPKQAIRRLVATGSTALYDAVVRVLDDLGEIRGRKALVVFSDGLDQQSVSSLERAIDMARRSEVIIYAAAATPTDEEKREHRDSAERHDLRMLAEETGGELHVVQRFKQLPQTFSAILADLRAQYSLTYDPPAGPAGERELRVELPEHRKYSVRCRRSYYFDGGG